MTASSTFVQDDRDGLLSPEGDGSSVKRANALSARISTVLSTSYADTEIRQALRLFELRHSQGGSDASYGSSDLKALAEKEVVDSNAQVVDDFGHVAAVSYKFRSAHRCPNVLANVETATQEGRLASGQAE
jgi:conserved oligomeric Golgi complex subunit 6